jgi:predicted nucleotidyltransferase
LKDQTFHTYRDVFIYLEDLFNCKIDLVPEEDVRPEIRPYILREVIYV